MTRQFGNEKFWTIFIQLLLYFPDRIKNIYYNQCVYRVLPNLISPNQAWFLKSSHDIILIFHKDGNDQFFIYAFIFTKENKIIIKRKKIFYIIITKNSLWEDKILIFFNTIIIIIVTFALILQFSFPAGLLVILINVIYLFFKLVIR